MNDDAGAATGTERYLVEVIERAADAGGGDPARQALRAMLADEMGVAIEGSLGDLAAEMAEAPEGRQAAAAVLLRSLAIPNAVHANETNGLARSIVHIVERALPEAIEFAHIGPKQRQTFERFGRVTRGLEIRSGRDR